ncbi:MAG: hypothetical protein ABIQ84_09085 [Usitatibacter sp.]
MSPGRTLATAGLWGAILTLVILAMSVLLRLGTELNAGEAVSTLPAGVEQSARILHRVAAMGVGILVAWTLVATWRERPVPRARLVPIACVVAITLLLSMIGRYTPGYKLDAVTVANVVGGIALASAFWWLRAAGGPARGAGDRVALTALGVLFALAALGAVADAAAMRGERAFEPLHLLLAAVFVVLVAVAAWRGRRRGATAISLVVLVAAQFGLGLTLIDTPGARPMALAWAHAMIACALALLLVGLAAPYATGAGEPVSR